MRPDYFLLLSHLRVQNANLVSSPITWGFPSPTAVLGFGDAIHRSTSTELDIRVQGVGVVCHQFEPQVFRPPGKRHRVLQLTRNPVGKDGKPQALIERGRTHLEVSVVLGLSGAGLFDGRTDLASLIEERARSMRFAGGLILPEGRRPPVLVSADAESAELKKLTRRLLPGFALVSRERALADRTAELRVKDANSTSLDALLDFARLNFECAQDAEDPQRGHWSIRKPRGWLVPIPCGYRAISPLYEPGVVRHTRDATTPFRFVESIYSLGQWLSPHRVSDLTQLLWQQRYDAEHGLYRCTTPHFAQQPLMTRKEG